MMRENTHLYFRPTPLTVTVGIVALVIIPVGLYYGIRWGHVPISIALRVILIAHINVRTRR